MDTTTLGPSIDWSTEFWHSAIWILKAFGVTAVCLAVVVALIGRRTEWGRQFVRITGPFFTGRDSVRVWLVLAALLASTVIAVRLSVLISYYTNDLFTSLQMAFQGSGADGSLRDSGIQNFWDALLIYLVLALVFMARFFADLYLTQRFLIRWRLWLTRRMLDDWLDGHAYFRGRFVRDPVDNPDQRVQTDVDIVTTGSADPNNPSHGSNHILLFGAIEAMLTVASFGVILWNLSGPLNLLGVVIPRALFWIVIVYVLAATVVAFWIGRPLIRLSFVNELRNAGFRYAMIRLKDSAAGVGLYRGEATERHRLDEQLGGVLGNYRNWLNQMMLFLGWNVSMSQAINPLPYVVQAQRLFSQQISFGDVMQSATAFGAIHDGLSFFRTSYDTFAGFRAALIRLDGLLDANQRARAMPGIDYVPSASGRVRLHGVEVRTPDGRQLVDNLELTLDAGETLLVTGQSGVGKTVLLQSLAGLWPYTSGHVQYPPASMFVPQVPYLPLGTLRAVVSYPHNGGAFTDDDIQHALVRVALPHLVLQLGDTRDWAATLSPGEQQRVAFARVLLHRPAVVCLDESTSALDEGLELMLYQLLQAELPEATVISVSHRRTVERFHRSRLELLGEGRWAAGVHL
jgi:vitamin B12/bleomycin/antimicrobial peptide transport system ATP-binding/permease protein